jgi:putative heme-binding domain-containing protein
VLYLGRVPASVVPEAIDNVLSTIAADSEYQWTSEIVFLIGESGRAEHEQILRAQLDNLSVRDAVLMVLSERPVAADRSLYLSGLESTQLNAVEACVKALQKLPRSREAAEQWSLLACARRLIGDKREFLLRESVMRLLQNNNEQTLKFEFGESGYRLQPESMQLWQEWLERRYPDYRPTSLSEQATALLKSLEAVPWDSGDAERGRVLFERLGCAKCHGGRRSLGPDLTGVSKRFSRADLFASIVDPNRDISNRYQTTSIETVSGQVLTGLIVYESVDGLLLRDAEHRTYRVEASEIAGRHQQRNSLMPEGLLRNTGVRELADLNSYLQGL